ncbi:hypothetical protein [Actinophytocola sp.]|uniref:hypothetical protein n=1 Tax=Actinophytocola sp. TaxID=1872138 RepID=UPI003899D30F
MAGDLSSYYSATNVSLAVGAALAATVPLVLVDVRGSRKFREPGLSLVWLVNYLSFAYLVGGALGWVTGFGPTAGFWFALGACLAWHVALRVGRWQAAAETRAPVPDSVDDAADRLVQAILEYAKYLHKQYKDRALLALRANTTRTLHLLGAHDQRAELGRLCLHAAQRAEDVETEASILLDDLGWAYHESGHDDLAREHITEAIELVEQRIAASQTDGTTGLQLLLIRGYRHLAAIAPSHDLDGALRNLIRAESQLIDLAEDLSTAEKHGLNAVYGHVVAVHYGLTRGETAVFPEGTAEAVQVAEAMNRVEPAITYYEHSGDIERAAKTAAIFARLARHRVSKRLREAAIARLDRLDRLVVRDLRRWTGEGDVSASRPMR